MESLILEPSLYTVKAILILDNDGERLFAKYYDDTYPSVKEQKAFEKNIFNKTHRTDSEIALLEGLTVVYKSSIDLYFYVIGSSFENEVRPPPRKYLPLTHSGSHESSGHSEEPCVGHLPDPDLHIWGLASASSVSPGPTPHPNPHSGSHETPGRSESCDGCLPDPTSTTGLAPTPTLPRIHPRELARGCPPVFSPHPHL